MEKENFTATRVAEFRCAPGQRQSLFWDAKQPNFGLRVLKSGARTYIFEKRLHGRTVRITIGDPQNVTLADARLAASELFIQFKKGINPHDVKAQERTDNEARRAAAKKKEITVGDAWTQYLAYQAQRTELGLEKAWGERHMLDHIRLSAVGGQPKKRGKGLTQPGPLVELMPLRLSELSDERIAEWLSSHIGERATMAALSYRLLRAFLNWCTSSKDFKNIAPADAYRARMVTDLVPTAKTREDDCLERVQLKPWFDAVCKLRSPVISAYLQTALLTGARRNEAAALRWTDVDFKRARMVIADKVEGSRVIPLPPYLAVLLDALPRRNEWVFSSMKSEDGKLAEPRKAHNQALKQAGLPHVSINGLRRSFGTLAEELECPAGITAQLQGHKPSAIAEKHYRRRSHEMLLNWHTKIEAWMLEQAGIEFSFDITKPGPKLVSSEDMSAA